MNDENDVFKQLDDREWAKRTKQIEKEIARERRKKRRSARTRRWLPIVVVVLAVFGTGYYLVNKRSSDRTPTAVATVPVVQTPLSGKAVASSPSTAVAANDPFANSPAKGWPEATAGLVLPTATPLGPFSADLVQDALNRTRDYLLTARTDSRVLVSREIGELITLLNPLYLERLPADGLDRIHTAGVTPLIEGSTLVAPVRVNVTISVNYVPDSAYLDRLEVTADLVWAYAPTAPDAETDRLLRDHVVGLRETTVFAFYDNDPRSERKVWIGVRQSFLSNIDCGQSKLGIIALPKVNSRPATVSTQSTLAPYDPRIPVTTLQSTC